MPDDNGSESVAGRNAAGPPPSGVTGETLVEFLDRLGQEVGRSPDANEIMAITTRLTAEYLNLSNCAYADMDEDQDGFTIRGNWHAPGSPSIVGHYSLAAFGALAVKELRAGRPLIINDNATEIEPHEARTFQDIGIAATLCMPLSRGGRLLALMAIHDKDPHHWSDYELKIIRAVTDRSWAHIERVRAEAELRTSNERFRAAVRATSGVLWTNDVDGRMAGEQPGWSALTGQGFDDYQGYGWAEAVHPDDAQPTLEAWQRAVEARETFIFEHRVRRFDGEWRLCAIRAAPVIGQGDQIVEWVGVHTDITEERAAAQALREFNETLEARVREEVDRRSEAEEALRQSQKMETVGQLTRGIAHDFNNLLQIVSGNLDLLRQKIPEDLTALRRYAERAMIGAERAATLTQRLLAFSRRQPLAPTPVDVNKLVAGMSELLHRTLGEIIEVEAVLAPRLWAVEADPNQLENTIINLAINARDAMPEGGKLTIETSNTHLDEAYAAQYPEVSRGQYVVMCISDSGHGMDADTVARAIEPFFTTKEVGRGTGLGLSMVYGFVKQTGGHLKIYSEPDEGTTIKIYLPRLIGKVTADAEAAPLPIAEATGEETILVCEDDHDVRAYSVEVLRELGYQVLEAADGPSALQVLRERGDEIDLLFTDVVLPGGMTGAVLAREAVAMKPGLKTLLTTGYARNAIVHQGRLDPGVELLTKPYSYADLAVRIRDILDRKGR